MLAALSFLTVIGRGRTPGPDAVGWFPLVGLALGAVLGGAWVGANELWPPVLAAALVVALDLALTGMLHLDGLADSADGLLPHLDRERRLEVMRQPDVGAFGVGVVVAVLLLRVAALASMDPRFLVPAVLWCTSRAVMAIGLHAFPYARSDGGLASAFSGSRTKAWFHGASIIVIAIPATRWIGIEGLAAVAAAAVAGLGVLTLARTRLGGFTGDVLGAAGMVAETVGLVVLAAKW